MNRNDNAIGLLMQVTLAVFIVTTSITYLFEKGFLPLLQILTGLFMFVTGYNNQKTYKQKYMTIAYIVCGLLFIGAALIG